MLSIGSMVKKLEALHETKGVTQWENDFIVSVVNRTNGGKDTSNLSGTTVDKIKEVHDKHYGGDE